MPCRVTMTSIVALQSSQKKGYQSRGTLPTPEVSVAPVALALLQAHCFAKADAVLHCQLQY